MMNCKIKQEKGITMVALVITVIILLIITNVLIFNAKDSVHIEALTNLYNDIELLNDKVGEYYDEYGKIPAQIKYTNISHLSEILSTTNDIGDFYVIDLEAMQGITLNYGKEYSDIKNNIENADRYTDVYIINENSHNIFYVQGISIENDGNVTTYYTNYTEPDETKVDLRYVDGIIIPEGYYYIGKENNDENESIVISTNKNEEINDTSSTQYIWQKHISYMDSIPNTIEVTEGEEETFYKSVNHYKGYFKNKNITSPKATVVYLPVDENKWSEVYTKNEKYTDKNGDTAYVPKGFRVSLAEGTNEIRGGLVITDAIDDNGLSIGNEFVWVPVDDFEEFIREDFGTSPISEENFITTEPTEGKYYELSADGRTVNLEADAKTQEVQEMYKKIKEYRGFYIGRYETGIEENEARTSSSDTSSAPVVKKNKFIYNYIKFGNSMTDETGGAVEKARAIFDNDDTYNEINTTLCYGVQWDAIMRWIKKDSSIKFVLNDSQDKGNYDVNSQLNKSGNYEAYQIKNIYDIAGNVAEWTMETYGTNQMVQRGGNSGGTDPITTRKAVEPNTSSGLSGFRIALYLK